MVKGFKHSNFCGYTYVFLSIACSVWASEVPRPRGVSLSRASLYNPSKDFTCFDGSLTIPFTQVNDDYCDCADASDEPGTAACPHGVFHCTNAGHKPLNLASSRVNDGVCDCCDATDEYAAEISNCGNNCNELGRTAREEAQKKSELLKAGKQLRAELSERGFQMKQEMKEKLADMQRQAAEAEKILREKETLKKMAEELEYAALQQYREIEEEEKRIHDEAETANTRKEATEAFVRFDSNVDGMVELSELQTRQSFDKDRNGEVSVEEAKFFLNDLDSVDLESFIADAWPRIKPFMMMDAGLFKPPTTESEGEAEDMQNEDELEHEDEHEEEDDEEAAEKEMESTPEPVKYDEETQQTVQQANDARNAYSSAEKSSQDIQNEIKSIEDYLDKDFGMEEEFASLQGQCFEYSDYEYIYKLCPFEKVTQQPKSGSADTRLGTWAKWAGSEDNIYRTMLYDHGQSCWNGPTRSTTVHLTCGGENKITAVSEPNRCEYMLDFTTPAACKETVAEHSDDVHDEL